MLNKAKNVELIFIVIFMTFLSLLIYLEWSKVFRYASQIPLLGWFIAYNCEPVDFYDPLSMKPLKEGVCLLEFETKYYGRHEIQIYPIVDTSHWNSNIGMKIRIRDENGKLIYEKEEKDAQLLGGKGLGNGTNVYNYCYAILNVPKDVPLSAKMYAHIECYGDINEIIKHNPNANIVIRKAFDK